MSFRIQSTLTEGRFIRANTDIPAGTHLVISKPVVSVIYAKHATKFCHYCFESLPLDADVVCEACGFVRYCSETCKQLDEPAHHPLECEALLDFPFLQDVADYRCLLKVFGLIRMEQERNIVKDPLIPLLGSPCDDTTGILTENQPTIVDLLALVSDNDSISQVPKDKLDYTRSFCDYLITSFCIYNRHPIPDGFCTQAKHGTRLHTDDIVKLWIHLDTLIQRNAFTIRPDKGFCLNPTASLFNHSCCPNSFFASSPSNCVLKQPDFSCISRYLLSTANYGTFVSIDTNSKDIQAITNSIQTQFDPIIERTHKPPNIHVITMRDIKKDEEIHISYISLSQSPYQRRRLLQIGYRFLCICDRCRRWDEEEEISDRMYGVFIEDRLRKEAIKILQTSQQDIGTIHPHFVSLPSLISKNNHTPTDSHLLSHLTEQKLVQLRCPTCGSCLAERDESTDPNHPQIVYVCSSPESVTFVEEGRAEGDHLIDDLFLFLPSQPIYHRSLFRNGHAWLSTSPSDLHPDIKLEIERTENQTPKEQEKQPEAEMLGEDAHDTGKGKVESIGNEEDVELESVESQEPVEVKLEPVDANSSTQTHKKKKKKKKKKKGSRSEEQADSQPPTPDAVPDTPLPISPFSFIVSHIAKQHSELTIIDASADQFGSVRFDQLLEAAVQATEKVQMWAGEGHETMIQASFVISHLLQLCAEERTTFNDAQNREAEKEHDEEAMEKDEDQPLADDDQPIDDDDQPIDDDDQPIDDDDQPIDDDDQPIDDDDQPLADDQPEQTDMQATEETTNEEPTADWLHTLPTVSRFTNMPLLVELSLHLKSLSHSLRHSSLYYPATHPAVPSRLRDFGKCQFNVGCQLLEMKRQWEQRRSEGRDEETDGEQFSYDSLLEKILHSSSLTPNEQIMCHYLLDSLFSPPTFLSSPLFVLTDPSTLLLSSLRHTLTAFSLLSSSIGFSHHTCDGVARFLCDTQLPIIRQLLTLAEQPEQSHF
ncbi:hypothetical protein BLNAU_2853 [Blattamonas nauphoetae]|uniref:SET domain-containing protein n=1 Tax=Blattamonas nauphoetae TaxID=2049346 RepID=A0ABQ9YEI8_9EUKA|nr:hypothetical protein BLNAU_2853 [Blattamonas nauphoetae]